MARVATEETRPVPNIPAAAARGAAARSFVDDVGERPTGRLRQTERRHRRAYADAAEGELRQGSRQK